MGDLPACIKSASILGIEGADLPDPHKFYRKIIRYYKRESIRYGDGKMIALSYPSTLRFTHEDQRLAEVLKNLGVESVVDHHDVSVKSGKLFHNNERVSFVILNKDACDVDPEHPSTYGRYLGCALEDVDCRKIHAFRKLHRARKYDALRKGLSACSETGVSVKSVRPGIPGFWKAVYSNSVGTSYIPGIEFTNDKEFYLYMEKIILHYLGEIPVLKNIPALTFNRQFTPDELFKSLSRWVIKSPTSKCGRGVWIGKNLSPDEVRDLRKRLTDDPKNFIAQEYMELSRVLEYSVDLRPFAMIAPEKVISSDVYWGRAIPAGKSGKVNISSGGLVSPVVVSR